MRLTSIIKMRKKHTNPNCQCASCKSKRGEMNGKNNPNFKGGLPKCKICGKELSGKKYKYCTEHCYEQFKGKKRPEHSKLMKGKHNSNFKNGKYCFPKYCIKCKDKITIGSKTELCSSCSHFKGKIKDRNYINFTAKLKEFIRKRDNNKCKICNKFGKDIHHIDYDKYNFNELNLITLCQKCHPKTNHNRDYWYAYFTYLMEERNE
jgi:hypothetical protein